MARIEYSKEFYCGFCGAKIKHGDEEYDEKGRARCPKDKNPLRGRPRAAKVARDKRYEKIPEET